MINPGPGLSGLAFKRSIKTIVRIHQQQTAANWYPDLHMVPTVFKGPVLVKISYKVTPKDFPINTRKSIHWVGKVLNLLVHQIKTNANTQVEAVKSGLFSNTTIKSQSPFKASSKLVLYTSIVALLCHRSGCTQFNYKINHTKTNPKLSLFRSVLSRRFHFSKIE